MSDPAKESHMRKDERDRKHTYENYKPIVLWVKSGRYMVDKTSKGVYPTEEIIKGIIKDNIDFDEFIDVAHTEPDVKQVVTEFDSNMLIRENIK